MGREKVPDAVVDGSDRSADGKKMKMKMRGGFLLGTDLAVKKERAER